jgi:hypothetical protein
MKLKVFVVLALVTLMCILATPTASASRQNPGACLLFPYYDNTGGTLTILTVTNVSQEPVWLRMVWIDEVDCIPRDSWWEMTGEDTFTFLSNAMIFGASKGFLYIYVVDGEFSINERTDIDTNILTGHSFVFDAWENGSSGCFAVNPFIIQAIEPLGDGNLFLDGVEFTAAPRTLYFPRFFGQSNNSNADFWLSKMVLINLTGGTFFYADADVYTYNDNESAYSTRITFDCFDLFNLIDVSPVTWNDFLVATNHDASEPVGLSSYIETGWMKIRGDYAANIFHTHIIDNAFIYGFMMESLSTLGFGADLSFHIEGNHMDYDRVMLWSTRIDGGPN